MAVQGYRDSRSALFSLSSPTILPPRRTNLRTEAGNNFVILPANGRSGPTLHLRAHSEMERQEWVNALELAKVAEGTYYCITARDTSWTLHWMWQCGILYIHRADISVYVQACDNLSRLGNL